MLKRKAYQKMLEWKRESNGSTALLIEGARRVGKSTLARQFGESEYASCVFIDFVDAPSAVLELFSDLRNDLDSFFLYLSAVTATPLHERDTLIVFDEVQAFPKAREALRQLVADGRYDYVETGSLVSIRENVRDIRIPSEERAMELNPLDFEEFLQAMGEEPLAEAIRSAFERRRALPDGIHRKAMRLWREYMLVGGMPQAVQAYVENRDFSAVDRIKRDILALYRNDIAKHANGARTRVTALFDAIPGQLAKHEKRFKMSSLGKSARMRDYEDAFFWLSDARVTNDCFNSTEPSVGLGLNEDRSLFKCYMVDTGLLVSHAFADRSATANGVYRDVLLGKISVNEGMLAENLVAQSLRANGHRLYFFTRYDAKAKRSYEVDFLIAQPYENAAMKMRVSPIEVKSGDSYETKSLDLMRPRYGAHIGTEYVLHSKQLRVEVTGGSERLYLPLYMAFCL